MEDKKVSTMDEAPPAGRSPTHRPRAWSRRLLVALSGVAVAVALGEWLEWPFLRRPVESALRYALERELSIGPDFGVRFVGGLRLRTNLLIVGPAPQGPLWRGLNPELLRAADLRLAVPYTTLLALSGQDDPRRQAPIKRPYLTTLEASRLDATLVRGGDGRANWHFGAPDQNKPAAFPRFGHLAIATGNIRLDDAVARVRLDATLRSFADSPSSGAEQAGQARMEIGARGDYRGQEIIARLRADGPLSRVDSTAKTTPVALQLELRIGATALDFTGTAHDVLQLGGFTGDYRLAGPSLAAVGQTIGVTLPTTATFAMRGRVVKDGAIWSTAVRELSVGSSRLNGTFRYDATRAMPKLTGRLSGARLSMPDLGPAIGATPAPLSARPSAAGAAATSSRPARLLPQREFDIPSLAAMDADVTVALEQFDLGTQQLETLAPLQARLLLENQVLVLQDIVARTAGGDLRGAISVDARRGTPLWNADLRWAGVQLERFVKPRNFAARDASGAYLAGSLGGRALLHGSGRSTAQVLASLDGDLQLWVRDGRISHFLVEVIGLDIAQALGMIVLGDEMLPMQCAVSALKVRRGNARLAAVIDTSDSTLNGTGAVSLADEGLRVVFRAQPKDLSPLALRAPLHIEGRFADPQVRLEKPTIGLRLAAAAALATLTPVAALLALVDLGEPEKQACRKAFDHLSRALP